MPRISGSAIRPVMTSTALQRRQETSYRGLGPGSFAVSENYRSNPQWATRQEEVRFGGPRATPRWVKNAEYSQARDRHELFEPRRRRTA